MRYLYSMLLVCVSVLADVRMLDNDTTKPRSIFDSDAIIDKMLQNEKENQAGGYRQIIDRYAKQYGLDAALITAIIKVESNFDRRAVSATDALGLMQVKLDQAVADVYKSLYGRYDLPRREQLFEPQFNISIGSAYLFLVSNKYFKEIKDPKAKEYCLIAAYNAGAGAVLRTFHDDKLAAQNIINLLSSDEVLRRLRIDLASEQGRRYLFKVMEAKKEFDRDFARTTMPTTLVSNR